MKPVIVHSSAREELDKAIAFYEQQKSGLGMDLLGAVERSLRMIQENPQLGASYKATRFRCYVVQGFPYVIFYRDLKDAIWIVAVAHGKRRPDYWSRRRME
ncbi:MAG: type II toxin-antitoxin system RelE/ParE family toxin [Desulfomonilaceae bacterium]|nr:type II toxin-antitoxin system RelE/ParE family toxin [Desulfomonilaceae bacterium]